LADRIERLTLRAVNHRETAADLLRAADRAEAGACRLSAYPHAIEAVVSDRQALDRVDRLIDEGACHRSCASAARRGRPVTVEQGTAAMARMRTVWGSRARRRFRPSFDQVWAQGVRPLRWGRQRVEEGGPAAPWVWSGGA
jgi:hypothetical protein